MEHLPEEVHKEFQGEFGVQWTENNSFSHVDEDHATEWVNGLGKGDAGLSDITQTASALLR